MRRPVSGKRHYNWHGRRAVILCGLVAAVGLFAWRSQPVSESGSKPNAAGGAIVSSPNEVSPPRAAELSDERLQLAADQLLALVDPGRPENAYFSDFVRQRLRWMVHEHGENRLQVALITDASNGALPPDVLMAAWKLGDVPTIFIAKPRFMRFLIETGATQAPFTQQQKNDFALALVHEIVHLQNPDADPGNLALRAAEESRVWREVSLNAVRPLRILNQPINLRFRQVDDALRMCRDELPCTPLLRLVRTTP